MKSGSRRMVRQSTADGADATRSHIHGQKRRTRRMPRPPTRRLDSTRRARARRPSSASWGMADGEPSRLLVRPCRLRRGRCQRVAALHRSSPWPTGRDGSRLVPTSYDTRTSSMIALDGVTPHVARTTAADVRRSTVHDAPWRYVASQRIRKRIEEASAGSRRSLAGQTKFRGVTASDGPSPSRPPPTISCGAQDHGGDG